MQTSTKKQLSATTYYLRLAMILSWPTLFTTGALLPKWRLAITTTPLSLAVIHALVLGVMLTVAFGVIYQIVPIAFQAPPISRSVLRWHLPLHIISTCILVSGFLLSQFSIVGFGAAILILNSLIFFGMVIRSYHRARNKTMVHRGLIVPLLSLWLVLFVGWFQALYPNRTTQSLIESHVLLGGLAFWGGLVIVFSYKLVPMFSVSHGYRAFPTRTFVAYNGGVLLLLVTTWLSGGLTRSGLGWIGSGLVVVGLGQFTVDVASIVRSRKRKRLVLPLYYAFLSTLFFVIALVGILYCTVFGHPLSLVPFIYLFVFGGLIPLMFSYMQKIVPFLWFEYRYSKRPERKSAPLIDEMVPRGFAHVGMSLYFTGATLGFLDLLHPLPNERIFDWSSATFLTCGSVVLFIAFLRVFSIGGPRPRDDD